jgi:hypothetical protein
VKQPNSGKRLFFVAPLAGLFLYWAVTAPPCPAGISENLQANPGSNEMPIRWHQAYSQIITQPERHKLEKGEILCALRKVDGGTAQAQTVALIKARPESCFRIVKNYNQYRSLMPYTEESRVLRTFNARGDEPGSEGVDFWTRVKFLGWETRYLLRIIHWEDPASSRYRSYWTLVDNPSQVAGCLDSEKRPCENDLSLNIGSHQFEPYPGNPNWTLHTYTLKVGGKHWFQRAALEWGGIRSLREVVQCLRQAGEKSAGPRAEGSPDQR